MNTARFLKYVLAFLYIIHEGLIFHIKFYINTWQDDKGSSPNIASNIISEFINFTPLWKHQKTIGFHLNHRSELTSSSTKFIKKNVLDWFPSQVANWECYMFWKTVLSLTTLKRKFDQMFIITPSKLVICIFVKICKILIYTVFICKTIRYSSIKKTLKLE